MADVAPSPLRLRSLSTYFRESSRALRDHVRMDIAYAEGPDGLVAYATVGAGPVDLLWCENWVTNLEVAWEQPAIERLHRRLGSFCRLIVFDYRGSGVSDPMPTARPLPEPTIEAGVEDALAVLDALGIERAAVMGTETGGWIAMQLAAMAPQRVDRLVLVDPQLKVLQSDDYPSGMPARFLEAIVEALHEHYARRHGVTLRLVAPDLADDPAWQRWMVRYERLALPVAVMAGLWEQAAEVDLRRLARSIQAPTVVIEHEGGPWPGHPGVSAAQTIPTAVYREVPGRNSALWAPQPEVIFDEIETFLTGEPAAGTTSQPDRVLTTVLFTDIVDSTRKAGDIGDRAWHDLLDRHDATTMTVVGRHRGQVVHHTGDGVVARFDGPTRAVHCGDELRRAVAELGLTIRVAIHTGEVEQRGSDVSGIGVHVAARALGVCEPDELLVTRTVRDLVTGSGIQFEDRGAHSLKGVEEPWQLYRVTNL